MFFSQNIDRFHPETIHVYRCDRQAMDVMHTFRDVTVQPRPEMDPVLLGPDIGCRLPLLFTALYQCKSERRDMSSAGMGTKETRTVFFLCSNLEL